MNSIESAGADFQIQNKCTTIVFWRAYSSAIKEQGNLSELPKGKLKRAMHPVPFIGRINLYV